MVEPESYLLSYTLTATLRNDHKIFMIICAKFLKLYLAKLNFSTTFVKIKDKTFALVTWCS